MRQQLVQTFMSFLEDRYIPKYILNIEERDEKITD